MNLGFGLLKINTFVQASMFLVLRDWYTYNNVDLVCTICLYLGHSDVRLLVFQDLPKVNLHLTKVTAVGF